MNTSNQKAVQSSEASIPLVCDGAQAESGEERARQTRTERGDARRWWIKLVLQPLLFVLCGAVLIISLGVAQKLGFLSGQGTSSDQRHATAAVAGNSVQYMCPMMCTPPQSEPGRCPVCGMELVPTTSGGGTHDSHSIEIDPAARRVANIHTVAVRTVPATRTVRAIGELNYDEGSLRTIAAYVGGRIERLYADYTGVVVQSGDHLALVYSPRLYSGQIELLLAKNALQKSLDGRTTRVLQSNRDLYDSANQRLIELGMTEAQIDALEKAGQANSRMQLCSPISGTVIEKLAVEGQYVKEGQPIYKLADLSTVWLMLELFPEDAAAVHFGQKVTAQVQSLPGESFVGRVAFIDPNVDPTTRTVGVRVVIPNRDGRLRTGDYAKATVRVPVAKSAHGKHGIYDPELADKWIGPRHPHVVQASPGKCPICGTDLVPAARFGIVSQPTGETGVLVVPRDAVLMAGSNSVLYVETKPGHFEIRRVVLGPSSGEDIVILNGVQEGEEVATQGNFLIDSQMQLAGNASLIDPTKIDPAGNSPDVPDAASPEVIAALAKLSPEDRQLAERQRICPVTKALLGSMGVPIKVDVNGSPVFICCEGCRASLLGASKKYLAILAAQAHSDTTADTGFEIAPPPIGVPEIVEPMEDTPPIMTPHLVPNTVSEGEGESQTQSKRVVNRSMEVVR